MFSLNITVIDLADLAYNGLLAHIKERSNPNNFSMLVNSSKNVWLKKAGLKKLRGLLDPMIRSLMLVLLIALMIVILIMMMVIMTFLLLSGHGPTRINLLFVLT